MSSGILAFQDNDFQLLNNILKKLSLQTNICFLKYYIHAYVIQGCFRYLEITNFIHTEYTI